MKICGLLTGILIMSRHLCLRYTYFIQIYNIHIIVYIYIYVYIFFSFFIPYGSCQKNNQPHLSVKVCKLQGATFSFILPETVLIWKKSIFFSGFRHLQFAKLGTICSQMKQLVFFQTQAIFGYKKIQRLIQSLAKAQKRSCLCE